MNRGEKTHTPMNEDLHLPKGAWQQDEGEEQNLRFPSVLLKNHF